MLLILLLFIVMLFLLLLSPVTRLPPCMFFSDVDDVVNNIVSVYCYVGLAIVVSSHWARTLYVILWSWGCVETLPLLLNSCRCCSYCCSCCYSWCCSYCCSWCCSWYWCCPHCRSWCFMPLKTNWIPEMRFLFNRLESQYTGALERSQIIKDELILERQNNEELK